MIEITSEREVAIEGRRWPAETTLADVESGGSTYRFRQAVVHHENGWAASIIWSSGSYSDNHHENVGLPWTEDPECVEVYPLFRGEFVGEPLPYVPVELLNQGLDYLGCLLSNKEAIVVQAARGLFTTPSIEGGD